MGEPAPHGLASERKKKRVRRIGEMFFRARSRRHGEPFSQGAMEWQFVSKCVCTVNISLLICWRERLLAVRERGWSIVRISYRAELCALFASEWVEKKNR